MDSKVKYANWWSKVLFKKAYENQFVIPLPPPQWLVYLLQWVEKIFVRPNFKGIQIKEPVFIVGLPRSGTSILYNTLCAHPDAAYITTSMNSFPEAMLGIEYLRKKFKLNIKGERFLLDSLEADFGSPSEPAMFWGKWMGRNIDLLNWEDHPIADRNPSEVARIKSDIIKIQYAFGDRGGEGDRKRFVCKYPVFQTELLTIQQLFPDAHFIHIVRDGRMVANSLIKLNQLVNEQIKKIKHPFMNALVPYPRVRNLENYLKEWGAADLRTTASVWRDSIQLVKKLQPQLKNFHEVRYEDLMQDPGKGLAKLFQRLGFRQLSQADQSYQQELNLWGKMHHQNQYGNFAVVEEIAGDLLKAYGY